MSQSSDPSPSSDDSVDLPDRLEEERFDWYSPEHFYPIHISGIIHWRYKVLLKLGYGSVSTAWLCWDGQDEKHVTLKVFVDDHRQARKEFEVLAHIQSVRSNHRGKAHIRTALDTFEIQGKRGTHRCLVHEPLALPLSDVREMCDGKLPLDILKPAVGHLLVALDFLHSEANVVHTGKPPPNAFVPCSEWSLTQSTDIQDSNIMISTADPSVWKGLEATESDHPSARTVDRNRVVYASTIVDIPDSPGDFILCDFGDAQFGCREHVLEVMPDVYRAPEIVLKVPWNEKIDIWNVGVLVCVTLSHGLVQPGTYDLQVWDLLEGKHLFPSDTADRDASAAQHLARMISLLGPPPKELIERDRLSWKFFNEDGTSPSGRWLWMGATDSCRTLQAGYPD